MSKINDLIQLFGYLGWKHALLLTIALTVGIVATIRRFQLFLRYG